MMLKQDFIKVITVVSCGGTMLCIVLHALTNVSPITGIWFPIYLFTLFSLSVAFSFKFIQWVLVLNKPLSYDLEDLIKVHQIFTCLADFLPRSRRNRKSVEEKEYDTNELSVISTVLEKRLVSSWYVPYVSQEIGFPFACKQMLDQIIGKSFQICHKIDAKEVFVDSCAILASHFREHNKALRKYNKCPEKSIEYYYKTSHIISNRESKLSCGDHSTFIVRVILKELVPWELWDTPHSELIIRILSKKLELFINNTLTDPVWLNHKLLSLIDNKTDNEKSNIMAEQNKKEHTEELTEKSELPIKKHYNEVIAETTSVESALSTVIVKSTAPILQRAINEGVNDNIITEKVTTSKIDENNIAKSSEPVEIKSSPILRQRRGRQGRSDVKIYDRIVEGNVKTWDTAIDLQCISLGQDLLASLDGEITLSRLWGQEDREQSPPIVDKSSGEEDIPDMEMDSPKESSPIRKEHQTSPKQATDVLLRELQSTVGVAKSRIGELQVASRLDPIDVATKPGDEAAGVMEGLLDFGIAGLKKGLRFTGLSDDQQEKCPHHQKEKAEKSPPPSEVSQNSSLDKVKEADENFTHKEENGINPIPPLIKQQRVTSQDSMMNRPKSPVTANSSSVPHRDSPSPQYEEAADLSASIAKLRALLQSTAANRTEDIWWETAEETKGRTQHSSSSKPVDTATLADEYDMNLDRSSPGQTSNNMQRLDKLFHRTVTGMFNTIRTAVGAEDEVVVPNNSGTGQWRYVATSMELSVGSAVARAVGSRKAYAHVDAALDSLDQLPPPPSKNEIVPEDFEEWCSVNGRGWLACSEVAAACSLCTSHVSQRIASLLLADLFETFLTHWLDDFTLYLRTKLFDVFKSAAQEENEDHNETQPSADREFRIEETVDVIFQKIPYAYLIGEDKLKHSLKNIVSSFSHRSVNKDVTFRLLDIFVAHFKKSAGVKIPLIDIN